MELGTYAATDAGGRARADTAPDADADGADEALRLSISDLHRSQSWAPPERDDRLPLAPTTSDGDGDGDGGDGGGGGDGGEGQTTARLLPPLRLSPGIDADMSALTFTGGELELEELEQMAPPGSLAHGRGGSTSGHPPLHDGRHDATHGAGTGRPWWAFVRRVLLPSQTSFSTPHDPVRRKQAGAHPAPPSAAATASLASLKASLPHRYHALLLLSDDPDADLYAHADAHALASSRLATNDHDHDHDRDHDDTDITDTDTGALLHDPRSEREQMTELTVSLLESSWVFLLVVGVLASVTAWTVDTAVLGVAALRERTTALGGAWLTDYVLYTSFRVGILLLGVACTVLICPLTAGSGIPEMRSILGGFPFPNYLSGRALVAKALGLVFALGSGLSIGKEGPFVHLSCIIAHQLLRVPLFRQIKRSQDLTHHVLAAACAVGVTATFGTPIGGVLFSIEVTTTYYVTSNYWRAFFSSVVGVVVFRQLNSLVSSTNVSLFATEFSVLPYEPYEMAFFLLLAAICGLLGALFVRTYRLVVAAKAALMARLQVSPRVEPLAYAALVALTFSLVEFPVGSFMLLSQQEIIDDMFSEGNLTIEDPTHLYDNFGRAWTEPSLALNLAAYVAVRFLSTAISATVMVPSGIVTPVFAVGAVIGRLFGEILVFCGGGHELAGGYAVVGAASFTAGVTGTISIAVIVFELTSQLSYMVPVLLCVLVGRSVALFFSLDMYETISREKNLPQWPDLTKQKSYGLTAGDLMRVSTHGTLHGDALEASAGPSGGGAPTYWVLRHQTLSSLRRILAATPRSVTVFPVVDSVQTLIYLGVADRDELEAIVEQWESCLRGFGDSSDGFNRRNYGQSDSLAAFAFSTSDDDERHGASVNDGIPDARNAPSSLTPHSRHNAMSSQLALAGVSSAQGRAFSRPESETADPVDLVKLGLLSLDSINFHVHRDTFASHVILLISVHKSPQLFVTARGKLLGVIHAADLLAQTRRFTL